MDKRRLRELWLTIHKWIGLGLFVVLVPLGITGTLLVWPDKVDAVLNPQRHVRVSEAGLAPSVYLAAARRALVPDERIATLAVKPHAPVVVTALDPAGAHPRPGPPARTAVWLDPGDAHVLDKGPPMGGAMRVIHNLHGSLMVPGVGRTIVGWFGVAMALSAASGLWIWWPVTGGWTRGLRWARRRETSANLHHQLGFWMCLPLFVLSVTGVLIAWPSLTGGGSGGAEMMRRIRARPLAQTHLTLDQAIAAAGVTASAVQVTWPTDAKPQWIVASGRTSVAVDDATGAATPARSDRNPGLARMLHEGEGLTIVWQVLVALAGLAPTVLAVTGIMIWLRARKWRGRVATARRRSADASRAPSPQRRLGSQVD